MFYSQGLVGPIVRFSEAAFKIALKKTIKSDLSALLFCFGHRNNEALNEHLFDQTYLNRGKSSIEFKEVLKEE